MTMRHLVTVLIVSLLITMASCHKRLSPQPQGQEKANSMLYDMTLKIGEQGAAFSKRYPVVHVDRQPAGVDFYEVNWNTDPRGRVTLDHGKHSLTINDVYGISGLVVKKLEQEGILQFELNAGLTTADTISHKEALVQMYAMLRAFEKQGWKSITQHGDPRLRGKDRLNYVLDGMHSISLDTNYTPNPDEWMRLANMTQWEFYADHLYLEVNFMRQSAGENSPNVGAYLIGFVIKSEAEYFRNHVKSEDRQRCKQVLPGVLAHLANLRAEEEAKLRAQGIAIDESYQDPAVPDLR
jgi:hypothetical protein